MAFNINAFLNEESRKDIKSDWKPVKVSVRKLRPAPDSKNFYYAADKEIKDLAESIELIGLQQYPVIRPVESTDEYEVIAGHKRRLAILRLLDEGKTEYEMIPCRVETPDDIRNELILIFTNSTQRERTDYEKMREIERVRELLTEYQKTHELTGRKQNIIAEILGTNKTKVGTLDNINNNLIAPFVEEFAAGKISTSTANEIAGLEPDAQQALYETYKTTGSLTAKDAKAVKEPQEPPKEAEAIENTQEPEKRKKTAKDEPISGFMNELETGAKAAKVKTYDRNILGKMIAEAENALDLMREYWIENQPREYTKQVMTLQAYKDLLMEHDSSEAEQLKNQEQPELPAMKNNNQRKAWLKNYKAWGLWYRDEHIDVNYYKYDFEDGSRLIVAEFPQREHIWTDEKYDQVYYHLIECGKRKYRSDKVYEDKYQYHSNSETELVEYLKKIQKKKG